MSAKHTPQIRVPQRGPQHSTKIRVSTGDPKPTTDDLFQAPDPAAAQVPDEADENLTADEINAQFRAVNPNHQVGIKKLRFSDMQIDPRYQRGVVRAEVNDIAKNFMVAAVGTPTISERVDPATGVSTYWVMDGQQRREGALEFGYDEPHDCVVHTNLTLAEEAKLFRLLNNRRNVSASAKFHAALTEGDPVALAIKAILDGLNIKLNDPRGFVAVTTARAIAKRKHGLDHLRWALAMIQSTLDRHGNGGVYDGRLVAGFVTFRRHQEGRFRDADLMTQLNKHIYDADDLLTMARNLQKLFRGHIATNVAEALTQVYNKGKSKNKLPGIDRGARVLDEELPVEE